MPLGIALPALGLKVGFMLLAFAMAFSGSRALSALHLVFLLPAVELLLLFCLQGRFWLFGVNPVQDWTAVASTPVEFSVQSWAKWYLNGAYAFYACETASAFVADSKQPQKTLQSLLAVAGLILVVYVVGSWLLLHLPSSATDSQDAFLTLRAAAEPYWGGATSLLVTFLIVSSSLLSFATTVSIVPRVLYQLAKDEQIPPLFAQVSAQGGFTPGLGLMLLLSLSGLAWGNVNQMVMVTEVGWLTAFIVLHEGLWFAGLWFQRECSGFQISNGFQISSGFQINRGLSWLALAMAGLELFVLIVGGWAWNWLQLASDCFCRWR